MKQAPGDTAEGTRPYRMTARAEAAQATGEAILSVAAMAFGTEPFDQVTLNDIADGADVSVQTVIRRFGSKEELFDAVADRERGRIVASRSTAAGSDLPTAVRALVDHYERDGDTILHLVAQEHHSDKVAEVVAEGRAVHREWVEQHCRPLFGGRRGRDRSRRIHAAIAATDLNTWKLLRRDLGQDREEVEGIMLTLLNGIGEAF